MDKESCEQGARVVVKAWLEPEYKARLLADGSAALAELGIEGTGQSADLVAVENTSTLHNLVVCTLCSCCASTTPSSVPLRPRPGTPAGPHTHAEPANRTATERGRERQRERMRE